jgi:hypothetical protein
MLVRLLVGIGMWLSAKVSVKEVWCLPSTPKVEVMKCVFNIKDNYPSEVVYKLCVDKMIFIKKELAQMSLSAEEKIEREEEIIGGLMSLSRHGKLVSDLRGEYVAYNMMEKINMGVY